SPFCLCFFLHPLSPTYTYPLSLHDALPIYSGLDQMLATQLAALGEGMSPWLMLSLVILITSVATEALSNNAIAVLFTPVVIGLAQQMGVDPRPFVVGVMFAASCRFATPIGSQTNTLVSSAGDYRLRRCARLGRPLDSVAW